MSDRELLEMAAKAAAIGGGWGDQIDYHNGSVDLTDYWVVEENDNLVFWNPLDDDGDALRLAVKVGLHVKVCRRMVLVESREVGDDQFERLTPDPYAATRRAIVRAAAEIGRTMP